MPDVWLCLLRKRKKKVKLAAVFYVARLAFFVIASGGCFVQSIAGQTIVESTFVGGYGVYSRPQNWSPAEVPNNTEAKQYNLLFDRHGGVNIDVDATISNLRTTNAASLSLQMTDHNFTVIETTSAPALNVDVSAYNAAAQFDAGTLIHFSDGNLIGSYRVYSSFGGFPATFKFRGAYVTSLRNAQLALGGPLAAIVDENGNDALRDLALVDSTSTFSVQDRSYVASKLLKIDGSLELGGFTQRPTSFTAVGGLENFDAGTRTLSGGTFRIGVPYGGDAPAVEFRFAGADIVRNGSDIELAEAARIADLAGVDALRNLAHNLPGARLAFQNRDFTTLGDFTNDGRLNLANSTFLVTGSLTNFDPATRTLNGGEYELLGEFRFRGADIMRNGAVITLTTFGKITDELGNDALRNLTENLSAGALIIATSRDFAVGGDFTNAGLVQTFAAGIGIPEDPPRDSTFSLPAGAIYRQTAGKTVNDGVLSAERVQIAGGTLAGNGIINGSVEVGAALAYAGGAIGGELLLSGQTRVRSVIDEYGEIVTWRVGSASLAGALEVEISTEYFLASDAGFVVLQSRAPLTGTFSNAPDGTRIDTVDGTGSFIVRYHSNSVVLTGFHAKPAPAQLLNISTRGYVNPAIETMGGRDLTAGFIITGAAPKTVALRGLGPSLTDAGVGSVVADPVLELRDVSRNLVVRNDNWRETQESELTNAGLALRHDREAAIHITLNPGTYTALLRDTTGSPGNALVEVYDLSPDASSKLANISTLGSTNFGNVLIGGIIAGGAGPANAELIVRAIGPHLRRSGVFNAMDDPTLELRDGNGSLIAFNDNWIENDEQFSGVARELKPADFKEAAMRVSLPPGDYTALVRNKNGGGGTALVEFYDLRR